VKRSRREVHRKTCKIPEIQFEQQKLTSYAGLVVVQKLFWRMDLRERLRGCFSHLADKAIIKHHVVALILVVHLLLGYRKLRDMQYYAYDPMVLRLLCLGIIPDVSKVSRALASADPKSVEKFRKLCRDVCLGRIGGSQLRRVTLDFDGSVLATRRKAEGTAVGYNKKRKGGRSYYPLFCTIAQTGQVFDFLYRSGNVHDSRGAKMFILECIGIFRQTFPEIRIEARMDSAFFSDDIVSALEGIIEFSISVPFERFAELKRRIESRRRWEKVNGEISYFEQWWKPDCWKTTRRFIFIRRAVAIQSKEPIQLDLFIPHEYGYEFKVIITNKDISAQKVLAFHNGRGVQEGIFAELKTNCHMDYVPVRTFVGNQVFLCSGILAHNLTRELQMTVSPPHRNTTQKRTPLWIFQQLNTLRQRIFHRAGRITRPQGKLTLTISGNQAVEDQFLDYLNKLQTAA
jgi:hypothetical protein